MFSGHDPNGDNLNQFVNFGIAAAAAAGSIGPIDWATLAQQWIQMRDHSVVNDINYNQTAMPEAPPPPLISGGGGGQVDHGKMKTYEEQGEADMDMDDDVQQQQHQQQQQQGIQDNSWLSEPIPPAPQWNAWAASTPVPMFQNSGAGVPMLRPPVGVNAMPLPGNTHAQIPSLLKMSVHHPPHMMKQIPPHTFPTAPPPIVDPSQSMPVIDAAKRKVLPAWIREGLEKMERDKLKQLEKEQQKQNESSSENDKENGAELELAREIIETDKEIISSNMVKSKYTHANLKKIPNCTHFKTNEKKTPKQNKNKTSDEEQENSGNEVELETTIHNNDDDQDQDDDDDEDKQQLNVVKSYEDKIAEMMMVVRRTLTELLLDVTNTEILNIAQETLKSQQAKASSAQVISKSALSSITGKLGLAVYGDSSSGESSDDEEESTTNRQSSNNDVDSEEELKRIIRMKKREFERTADEIEDEIAAAAELEEKRFKLHAQREAQVERRNKMKNSEDGSNSTRNMGKSFVDQEFGETTSDSKLPYLNGKEKQQRERLMRKERTTRFSDSREPKTVSLAAAAKYFSQLQQQQQQQHQQQQQQNLLMTTAEYDAGTSGTGASGLNNMLNAAEAALKKASKAAESSKLKSSVEHNQRVTSKHERQHKRSRSRSRSTNSSTSSSKTNSYTSSMSDRRHHKKHRSKDKRKEKQRRRERRSSSRSRSTSRSSDEDSRRKHRRRSRSRSRSRSSYRKRSSSRDYDRHSKHHKERSTSSSYSRSSRSHSTHYSRHKH